MSSVISKDTKALIQKYVKQIKYFRANYEDVKIIEKNISELLQQIQNLLNK